MENKIKIESKKKIKLNEKLIDEAVDKVMDMIAKLLEEYTWCKDKEKSKELKEKIEVLEKIKDQIYMGNEVLAKKMIDKNRKDNY